MNSIRTSRVAMRVIREVPTSLRQALAAIGLSGRKLLAATVALVIVHVFPGICFGSYQISPQSGVILDASFGSGGKVVSDLGTDSFATASIIQHDGKIVVAGCTTATTQGLVNVSGSLMARYNSDGTIDTTFGANGVTTITTSGFGVTGIALQSDGKILLVGGINLTLEGAFLGQLTLVRLNANGSLDTSFGTNGLVIDSNGGIGLSVAIQGDGKIVATGTLEGPGPQLLTVNRYNTDGSLDTTFGTGGTVHTSPMLASELVIQKDGKIVLAGQSFATPAVMRLNTDGSPDTGFGTGGTVQLSGVTSGGEIFSLAIQADGKIVIAGGTFPTSQVKANLLLIRCNADGSLDSNFGTGGIVTTDLDGLSDAATSVTLQADGEIVVAGAGFAQPSARNAIIPSSAAGFTLEFSLLFQLGSFGLARYNTDGSLDPSFGAGGRLITTFPQQIGAAPISAAIQTDGRILAVGSARFSSNTDFALVRYQPSGQTSADFSLSTPQQTQTAVAGSSVVFPIATQPVGPVASSNVISLTASVSPAVAGVTAALSPNLVAVGSGSSLTVNVPANTQPGPYTITVNGTSGAITHTLILTVNVQASSFSLGFSQSSITVVRPSKVRITVMINRTNGFSGTVTVSAPGSLPAAIVLKSNNQVATTGTSATFVFKVKQRAAPGSDPLTFTGEDSNGHTQAGTVTLVIQ